MARFDADAAAEEVSPALLMASCPIRREDDGLLHQL